MVTAVASTPKHRPSLNPKRPPLLPSDSDNAPPRRPKPRQVTSRYLSSSSSNSSSSTNTTSSSVTSGSSVSSRRSQSPMLSSRASSIASPKAQQRAVSAERRRPSAATATPFVAEKMLVKSVRSLSVSFQGESYSLPVSKAKPPPAAAGTPGISRKGTPERRKAGVTPVRDRTVRDRENPRQIEQQQHRWPARLRCENPSSLSRSLDYGTDKLKWNGSGSGITGLRKSLDDEFKLHNGKSEHPTISDEDRPGNRDSLNSDVDSVSSDSTVAGNTTQLRGGSRGIIVPARFWQDASNRVQKVIDPASPLSNSASNKTAKIALAKKFKNDSPVSSPREICSNRGLSPLRGASRAASPSKALTSPGALSRGMASPSRARSGAGSLINDNNMCSTPSMVNFPIELRRGKFGENRIADAHDLRMLYNRLLQWRLANAKVENSLLVQKQAAERNLYNAWVNTSKLRHSVSAKGIELQMMRLNLKLYSILKEQGPHLERWGLLDRNYCNSISGAIKALEASTIRLPVADGAKSDARKVQEAIYSAVDVMQAMESSIYSSQLKVEHMSSLTTELSKLSRRELRLLDQCKDLLSARFIPLQVMNWSLTVRVLQDQCSEKSFSEKA